MSKAISYRDKSPERQRAYREERAEFDGALGDPANAEVWIPSASKIVSPEGSWVLITRALPPMEYGLNEKIRVARIFYGERQSDADEEGFRPDGTYKLMIHSPWGDVCVFPYEYSMITFEKIIECWQAEEIIFHSENVEAARFNDIVFYARSRGIGIADAMVFALGTLKGPVGWFEPRADIAMIAEDWEEWIHRWKPHRRSKKPMTIFLNGEKAAVIEGKHADKRKGGGDA